MPGLLGLAQGLVQPRERAASRACWEGMSLRQGEPPLMTGHTSSHPKIRMKRLTEGINYFFTSGRPKSLWLMTEIPVGP